MYICIYIYTDIYIYTYKYEGLNVRAAVERSWPNKTVRARFCPWLSGDSTQKQIRSPSFARGWHLRRATTVLQGFVTCCLSLSLPLLASSLGWWYAPSASHTVAPSGGVGPEFRVTTVTGFSLPVCVGSLPCTCATPLGLRRDCLSGSDHLSALSV